MAALGFLVKNSSTCCAVVRKWMRSFRPKGSSMSPSDWSTNRGGAQRGGERGCRDGPASILLGEQGAQRDRVGDDVVGAVGEAGEVLLPADPRQHEHRHHARLHP